MDGLSGKVLIIDNGVSRIMNNIKFDEELVDIDDVNELYYKRIHTLNNNDTIINKFNDTVKGDTNGSI